MSIIILWSSEIDVIIFFIALIVCAACDWQQIIILYPRDLLGQLSIDLHWLKQVGLRVLWGSRSTHARYAFPSIG